MRTSKQAEEEMFAALEKLGPVGLMSLKPIDFIALFIFRVPASDFIIIPQEWTKQ